jgi:hypothetical protein
VSIIHEVQGYTKTAEDAVADVLKAGMTYDLTTTRVVHNIEY